MPPSADDFDDDEFVPLTAEELQRELDRMTAGMPKVEDPLPEDLAELRTEIRGPVLLRRTLFPDLPFAQFEGFEARDVMIGGMGLVIEAYDRTLERKVAIKLWIQSGPKAQAALLAEARTLAKLSHPNVVTIHGTGRWGDRVYFIMEWIEGVDGHAWLEQPRPWQEVLEVFVLAGMGLAAAHDEGIQHRDFKPSNILLGDDGRVLVADFGVAASLLEVATEDERGKLVGTPRYMAPERLRGELGDARSDQFSFCVALWRALYRLRPFAGDTGDVLLEAIERGELREDPAADVPSWLQAVVSKGLARDPAQRHANMHQLVDALIEGPPEGPSGGRGGSLAGGS